MENVKQHISKDKNSRMVVYNNVAKLDCAKFDWK